MSGATELSRLSQTTKASNGRNMGGSASVKSFGSHAGTSVALEEEEEWAAI
jgi:hypothetical protein